MSLTKYCDQVDKVARLEIEMQSLEATAASVARRLEEIESQGMEGDDVHTRTRDKLRHVVVRKIEVSKGLILAKAELTKLQARLDYE